MTTSDPTKRILVDAVIANQSRLRLLRSVEADLSRYAPASGTLIQLQQLIDACRHNYRRALQELRARPSAQPSQPQPSTATSAKLGSSRQKTVPSLPDAA